MLHTGAKGGLMPRERNNMAKLHMVDGKIIEVTEDKAQAIYAVLNGTLKPRDAAQEEFCTNVSNVTFDTPKPRTEPLGKGYESFKRVGEQIKTRVKLNA
jgi:hypothetical protein